MTKEIAHPYPENNPIQVELECYRDLAADGVMYARNALVHLDSMGTRIFEPDEGALTIIVNAVNNRCVLTECFRDAAHIVTQQIPDLHPEHPYCCVLDSARSCLLAAIHRSNRVMDLLAAEREIGKLLNSGKKNELF